MVQSIALQPSESLNSEAVEHFTPLNVEETVSITTAPNGTSSALVLEVPVNHAVTGVDLSLRPSILPMTDSISWNSAQHWNATGTTSDRVNYNSTQGLSILPREISWDFENSNHGWTLGTGWLWGYDSCLGQSGGVHGGTKAIYTYNCNYPNGIPSSGYFATSPIIDCSSCSGSWYLDYWKRLGIEYHYYDDAQVHVKDTNNNWQIVWDHSGGSTNPSSWTKMTHDISNYVNGNSNLQVRFKLGRTDGSVTYTGWNVDDVEIRPASGGLGTGANWTSSSFGPGAVGPHKSDLPSYGIMSIDATVSGQSSLSWTVLDGSTDLPISGFEDRIDHWADLGAIDPEAHPSLRLKLTFDQATGSPSPVVHGVHVQGIYSHSFSRDPNWTGSINWNSGSYAGSGEVRSPVFTPRAPISRVKPSLDTAGGGTFQASFDSASWISLSSGSWHTLSEKASTVQFKWLGSSSSSQLMGVEIAIDSGGVPQSPRIDLAADGWREWELDGQGIGKWGWQDRLSTGGLSHHFSWTTTSSRNVGMLIPRDGLDSFSFNLVPGSTGVDNLSLSFEVGGVEKFSRSLGTFGSAALVTVNNSELISIEQEALNTSVVWPSGGAQVGQEYVQGVFKLQADYGSVLLSGIVASHSPIANLSFQANDPMVLSINDMVPHGATSGSSRMVGIPIQADSYAALKATITNLDTTNEVSTDSLLILNGTTTLAPSRQWLEVKSTHTAPVGTVSAVQLDLVGVNVSIQTLCRQTGDLQNTASSHGPGVLHWMPVDACVLEVNGTSVESTMRFRLNASWDDEESMLMKVRVVLIDGRRSVPRLQAFGIGENLAIENDVEITGWRMLNDLGLEIPADRSFLKSNSPISVEVDLGFTGLSQPLAPRAGDVAVRVFENDVIIANSTALVNGSMNFQLTTPSSSQDTEYRVDVYTLHGQENASANLAPRSFTVDSLPPMVIDCNIRKYDHLTPSLSQPIRIQVYDQPLLPDTLHLMLWRDWLDDENQDGMPNATEFQAMPLNTPLNTSHAYGNYTFSLDDTDGPNGGLVAGYVDGADAAGNLVTRGGSEQYDDQMFIYQLASDGAPLVTGQGGLTGGSRQWLHPSTTYEMSISFEEPNGVSDLDDVRFELASNSIIDTLEVIWNASNNRCSTQSPYLNLSKCHIYAAEGSITPFTQNLELKFEFSLGWDLPTENDLRRAPAMTVSDRSGSSSWLELPQLRWRLSPDLAIESDSITLEVNDGKVEGQNAWVQPSTQMNITGRVSFVESGDMPNMPLEVSLLMDGQRTAFAVENGYFSAALNAPSSSKSHALTFELTNLDPAAVDATDSAATLYWIEVDGNAPEPASVDSPRLGTEVPVESLEAILIEIRLSELEMLDSDSLRLHFKVTRASQPGGVAMIEDDVPLELVASGVGQSILAKATINLSERLPEDAYQDALSLGVWVKGSDMAGNSMKSNTQFNSGSTPFAIWDLEHLSPEISLTRISYSRSGQISTDQITMVTIELRNTGRAPGTASLLAFEVGRDGENRSITPVPISVAVGIDERVTYDMDWIPEKSGERWVVVTLVEDGSMEGEHVSVTAAEGSGGPMQLMEGVPLSWILVIVVLLLILTVVVSLALRTGGSTESALSGTDDWEDEWDGEWEDEDEPSEPTYPSPTQTAQSQPQGGYGAVGQQMAPGAPIQGGIQQQPPMAQGQPHEYQNQWTEAQWQAYQAQYASYYQNQGQQPPQQ